MVLPKPETFYLPTIRINSSCRECTLRFDYYFIYRNGTNSEPPPYNSGIGLDSRGKGHQETVSAVEVIKRAVVSNLRLCKNGTCSPVAGEFSYDFVDGTFELSSELGAGGPTRGCQQERLISGREVNGDQDLSPGAKAAL